MNTKNIEWSDINADGRRLETAIRKVNSNVHIYLGNKRKNIKPDHDLALRYLDSLAKLTESKIKIVDRVLAVKKLLRQADKQEVTDGEENTILSIIETSPQRSQDSAADQKTTNRKF